MNNRLENIFHGIRLIGVASIVLSLIFSVIYLIMPNRIALFTIAPWTFLLAIFSSCILLYQLLSQEQSIIRQSKTILLLSGVIIPLFMIFALLSFLLIFLIPNTYFRTFSEIPTLYVLLYGTYFGTLLLAAGVHFLHHKSERLEKEATKGDRKEYYTLSAISGTKKYKIIKILALWGSIFLNLVCILFMIVFFLGDLIIFGAIGIAVAPFSLFYIPVFLGNLVIFAQVGKKLNPKFFKTFIIIGVIGSSTMLIPVISTPHMIRQGEQNFAEAFGEDWNERISQEARSSFMETPFAFQEYYLGSPEPECIVLTDRLYYAGDSGVDDGIRLHYDAYLPTKPGIGQNSTIIRIHGGAWVLGDKGQGNFLEVNKYFAAQGYVVFDVQYGIYDIGVDTVITEEHQKGNFTLHDMVRHLGIFTQHLIANQHEYGANLSSTFISGGSAGGQLASGVALGIASGDYPEMFGTGIEIKGLIPFYPANGLAENILDADTIFHDPADLVTENSPPALIIHGDKDGLVPPHIARDFQDAYYAVGRTECAIIWHSFAGHAGDLHYFGPYSQVGLYFMERFLYLHR